MKEPAFANVLKKLRLQKGLSQEDLGFKTGLHRTYISQLERGLKSPSLATLRKIAVALEVSLTEFMFLVEQEQDNV